MLAVTFTSWHFAERAVRPAARIQAEHYARRSASETISAEVSDYLDDNRFTYTDFAAVLYDESGRVVSVEAIPYNINKVQSELTLRINKRFRELDSEVTRIPIGTLSGNYLLSGKGPGLKLRICPAEEVTVRLESEFTSAGMNQTTHRISAIITAEVSSSMPIYSFSTKVEFEFLIAETVIIGEVPALSRYAWSSLDGQAL